MKLFAFGPVVQEEMLLKEKAFCSEDSNRLCNYSREHHEEHFCEIIFDLDQ